MATADEPERTHGSDDDFDTSVRVRTRSTPSAAKPHRAAPPGKPMSASAPEAHQRTIHTDASARPTREGSTGGQHDIHTRLNSAAVGQQGSSTGDSSTCNITYYSSAEDIARVCVWVLLPQCIMFSTASPSFQELSSLVAPSVLDLPEIGKSSLLELCLLSRLSRACGLL